MKCCAIRKSKRPQKIFVRSKVDPSYEGRSSLANFIKILFNFMYYLGACPFRFEKRVDRGVASFRKKVWRPQQIACALLHALCINYFISIIRQRIPMNWELVRNDPSIYFHIASGVCSLILIVVLIKRIWFNGHQYLAILNCILREKHLPVTKNGVKIKDRFRTYAANPTVIRAYCAFTTLKMITFLITGFTFVGPISQWSPSWWLRRIIAQGRFVFCFADFPSQSFAPALEEIITLDYFLVVLMLFADFIRYAMIEFAELIMFAFVITLWTPASAFDEEMKDRLKAADDDKTAEDNSFLPLTNPSAVLGTLEPDQNANAWPSIYKSFQAIYNFSEVVNSAIGSQLTWYMLHELSYYSFRLHVLLFPRDELSRVWNFNFFLLAFVTLYLSADICSKMESIKSWFVRKDNLRMVPANEAQFVFHELATKSIGIHGNLFTITFPLLSGFLSLILTLFVMGIQYGGGK